MGLKNKNENCEWIKSLNHFWLNKQQSQKEQNEWMERGKRERMSDRMNDRAEKFTNECVKNPERLIEKQRNELKKSEMWIKPTDNEWGVGF